MLCSVSVLFILALQKRWIEHKIWALFSYIPLVWNILPCDKYLARYSKFNIFMYSSGSSASYFMINQSSCSVMINQSSCCRWANRLSKLSRWHSPELWTCQNKWAWIRCKPDWACLLQEHVWDLVLKYIYIFCKICTKIHLFYCMRNGVNG